MKILVIRVSAIGDVVHTLPAIFYLHAMFPHAKISWVVQEKAASLLQKQPILDRLFVLPNNFLKCENLHLTFAIIKQLRQTKWDIIIDFQGLLKTSVLIFFLHGKKFGFDKANTREKISARFTHHHLTPVYTNIIQKNMALVSGVIEHIDPVRTQCPSITSLRKNFDLHVPEENKHLVNSWLTAHSIRNFIILAPNTTWPSKHWPLEHWQKLIHLLQSYSKDFSLILLGASFGDQAKLLAKYTLEKDLTCFSTPFWDLLTTAYLIKKTTLFIGPDTGLLHLCDFLGTTTIGLFGPSNAKKHGPFLCQKNIDNAIQISCPHSYQKNHGEKDCMASLLPEKLLQIISRIIYP